MSAPIHSIQRAITSFFIIIFSFFSMAITLQAHAEKIITPVTIYYELGTAGVATFPSMQSMMNHENQKLHAGFLRCTRGDWIGSCTDMPYSSVSRPATEARFQGQPMSVWWGANTGIAIYRSGNTVPTSIADTYARMLLSCPKGFSFRSDGAGSGYCLLTKTKTNACGTGNPINVATGTKYESEVDYASADGALRIERFYLDAFRGWSVDLAPRLVVINSGETLDQKAFQNIIPLYQGVISGMSRGYIDDNNKFISEEYDWIYSVGLLNITQNKQVSIFIGSHTYTFSLLPGASSLTNDDKYDTATRLTETAGSGYLLTTQQGVKYYFDRDGQLQSSESSDSDGLTYTYNNGLLVSKKDQAGRQLLYTYDSNKHLVKITLPDGLAISYEYESNDPTELGYKLLKRVVWPNGESVSYTYNEKEFINSYDGKLALTGKFDSNGQRIGTYKYAFSKAISTEGFNGINKKQLSITGTSTSVIDAINSTRTFRFIVPNSETKLLSGSSQPAGSGCNASTQSITYYTDTDLKKSEKDFNGYKQQFSYDFARKLETVRVEGVPSADGADYLSASAVLASGVRKTSTQWHGQYNKPIKTAEPRLLTTFVYNGDLDPFNGNAIAQCSPSPLPLLCHKIQQATTDVNGAMGLSAAIDSTISQREWLFTYNDRGQLLTTSRALNAIPEETREYYEFNTNFVHKGDLKRITNALGQHIDYTEFDANGRVLRMSDVNGVETKYSYDARGRLASQAIANAIATTHIYDLNGNRVTSVLPNGVTLNYQYDPAKRLTSIANAEGDKISYEYDLESNLRFERVANASGAIGYIKENIYDALSRKQNTVNSFGQSQTHLYDANGNPTGDIDAKQQVTSQSFNALNQLKITTDALNGKTDYSYDGKGRITQIKDPKGNATTYLYNAFGDLISQTSPDTGTTTFTYDALGNRIGAVDARAVQVEYRYDALNRLTLVKYPAATAENITYSYDANITGNYGIGRVASITNTGAGLAYKYNALGLVSQKTATVNAIASKTQYLYDAAGGLSRIIYPSGRVVNYSYDLAGRVVSVKTKENILAAEQTVVSGINYLPFGPASNYVFGNGLSHLASYDNDYRLTGIQVGGILNRSYSYDPVDNITAITNLIASNKSQRFIYDALNRLTNASGVYGDLIYTYDAVGNRTSEQVDSGTTHLKDTYIYPATNNRLTSISKTSGGAASGTRSFSYDAAGNRTQGTAEDGKVQTYTYNKANRLQTAKVTSALVGIYAYNALGQRVSKTLASGSKEIYHYDEAGQLIAVTDAVGKNLREYIYNGNQLVGFVNVSIGSGTSSSSASTSRSSSSSSKSSSSSSKASSSAITGSSRTASSSKGSSLASSAAASSRASAIPVATLYYVHNDHLGTPQVVTAKNKAVVFMADYKPFGKLQAGQVNSINLYSRFPGQFLDIETGLYYNYFRDYDPSVGRYIESDPIGLEGGINTYAYALNNPISKVDLLGLATDLCSRNLNNVPFQFGPFFHQYVCVPDGKGGKSCGGLGPSGGNPFNSPGTIEFEESPPTEECKKVADDDKCIEQCVRDSFNQPPPNYSMDLSNGQNCQTWAQSTVQGCKNVCRGKK